MIKKEYEQLYNTFINHYENVHVNPWHEISKEKLQSIYNDLINKMDIDSEESFNYLMKYVIKRLSGKSDAHTMYEYYKNLPICFKIIDDEVLINYPVELKGSKLLSINGIPIDEITKSLDEIITYGTEGRKRFELENFLRNKGVLLGMPCFKDNDKLNFVFEDIYGNNFEKTFIKDEKYDENVMKDLNSYLMPSIASYYFQDNCLIYNHRTVQKRYEDIIKETISSLEKEDISSIDTIIVDIRGNIGGNSLLNGYLMDYLKKYPDKKLICLTDYRVFSGGRYALLDLIRLGAMTIGDKISTPLNCYGNCEWLVEDEHYFSSSSRYLDPYRGIYAHTKEDFLKNIKELDEVIFEPDILVTENKEDFINGVDTILNEALMYVKKDQIKK